MSVAKETVNAIGLMKAKGLDDNTIAEMLDIDVQFVTPIPATEQLDATGNTIKEDGTPTGNSGYTPEVPLPDDE